MSWMRRMDVINTWNKIVVKNQVVVFASLHKY
jgi:hypothetical protein